MLRLRKKFSLLICAICMFVFLLLYLILNFKIPSDKQYPQSAKLLPPENRFNQILEIAKNALDKTYDQIPKNEEDRDVRKVNPKFSSLNRKEMFKEAFINANDNNLNTCPIQIDTVPQPDIQMLDIYKDLKFDNIDGGVWKQGWQITYQENDFNAHHKLKVFVVPHSHNDPGWIKTFDAYYENSSKHILSNMLRHLSENPSLKFIWAEISYFSRYFEDLGERSKETIKRLVNEGQLEFVTGGWVMTDEANSHWLSVLMQLSEGQSWLKKHLNYTPKTSWAIDPFGYSPVIPYILKKSGIENLLIQRTHYSVKKRFARERQLEFKWRQIWDGNGDTELFTHMMPFYSYDIPHTCGPDPKICCQFDFKRLNGFGINCPWKVPPQAIDDSNVAKRAEMIVDQWKKKSQLYKTRSVLIPLGDDFRYDQSSEWEAQRINYEHLFEYINNNPQLYTEAKFGTLQDYFDSVREEKNLDDFPSLSGDFFTYADRDDHYWSGYYTSRPYHKRMDRVLLHYIRSAEIMFGLSRWGTTHKFYNLLTDARRQLSLFQHHDGITGTAKTHVVSDYASRMVDAVKNCKLVMQQGAYQLLTKPSIYSPDYKFLYFNLDDSRWPGVEDSRTTIILGEALPNKHVVFFNSLPKSREEIVEFHVSTPFVYVTDFKEKKILSQVSPVWSWHKGFTSVTIPQASTTKYRLLFKVNIPPFGLATYIIHSMTDDDQDDNKDMKLALITKNTILSSEPFTVNLGEYPSKVEFAAPKEISLTVTDGPNIAFTEQGLLKSMALDPNDVTSPRVPTRMEFMKYVSRRKNGNSGAYLFLPNGEATKMFLGNPTLLVQQGPLESSVTVGLPFSTLETKIISGSPAVEIRNLIDINSRDFDDNEVSMKFSTSIKSGDTFFTDLNAMNIIKRQRFSKLPLQANFYPIPSSIYIENESVRFTVLTSQPLGGSSLNSGEIEIMQDRRLLFDDERGLGQGVVDNQPTLHIFRVLLENVQACNKRPSEHPAGFLTSRANEELQTMLYPLDKLIYAENEWVGAMGYYGEDHEGLEDGMQIGVLRKVANISKSKKDHLGLVIHRTNLEDCPIDSHRGGVVNVKSLLNLGEEAEMYASNLTLLTRSNDLVNDDIKICPMDTKAFVIQL